MNNISDNRCPSVAFVIPVHNNKEDTKEFLESLKRVNYPNYKVIIIDDGSTDGTEKMIREFYPDVILLQGDGDLWWSRATNLGIEKAIELEIDYVLMSDHDTIMDKDFLFPLVENAENNFKTITFSKGYWYESKIIHHLGWNRNGRFRQFTMIGVGEIDDNQYNNISNVEGATISVLVKTDFFSDIGLMDYKKYPQYWADLDFSYRAYKKGYRIMPIHQSIIWHRDSSSVKKKLPKKPSMLETFSFLVKDKRSPQEFTSVMHFLFQYFPPYLFPILFMGYLKSVCIRTIRRKMK